MMGETPLARSLSPDAIRAALTTAFIGREIFFYEDIPSTNDEAKRLAAEGATDGALVIAEEQSRGRGRLSRGWFSPRGKGLWFSLILRPDFLLPQDAPKCTLLAAVAIARAIRGEGLSVGIKWPNDILFDGKKLVGILTEMRAEDEKVQYIVIGAGVNVNIGAEDFPAEIAGIATSLSIMRGGELSRLSLLAGILEETERLYLSVRERGFAPVLDEWRELSVTLGRAVNVLGVGETFSGIAADIDAEGALLIDTGSGRRRVLAGDVSLRPKTD